MGEPVFEREEVFDRDYLYFYVPIVDGEQAVESAALLWRLLRLRPAIRVLDLACGHGRIANELAATGACVFGLDREELFLRYAVQAARSRNLLSLPSSQDAADSSRNSFSSAVASPAYVQGDMRFLPFSQDFERVVCWFSSFGYFGDEDNRKVLREVHRSLCPGGLFLLDLQNRERLVGCSLSPLSMENGEDCIVDTRWYDPMSGRLETTRLVYRGKKQRRVQFSVRLFSFPEIRDWLRHAGFKNVQAVDEQGGAYDPEKSYRMIVLSEA